MAKITKTGLRRILTDRLKLKDALFELEELSRGKISGSVVSDSFQGLKDSERQRRIWDALDEELGKESTRVVGTLLAYTQAEWNVDLEESN